MKNFAYDILDVFSYIVDEKLSKGLKVCTVKTVTPLVFTYNDVDIGTSEGDEVYVHPLFMPPLIELDVDAMKESQDFLSSTAYSSPTFKAVIQGTIPDFLQNFYDFFKNWQSIFVLKEGDFIAVYETDDEKYLVLQKIIKDEQIERSEDK